MFYRLIEAVEQTVKTLITDEALQLMDERRKSKNQNIIRFKELNKQIYDLMTTAKGKWHDQRRDEKEDLQRQLKKSERIAVITGKNDKTKFDEI